MKTSVIIPTYQHCDDLLKPCIESIIKYTDLSDIEIVIVANGCTDGTREYVKSLGDPFKLVWFDEGLGFTKATNEGVKASTGENIILMNNDVVLLDQPKNQWREFLETPLKDNIGITANLKIWDYSVERMFAVFFLCAFPRHIWDKVGPLDESWSPGGGEDIEFCILVEQLGYKIIQVPDEHNDVINGINVNRFMSYHAGEATMMDAEHKEKWEIHIADVRKRLEYKYKLPQGWFYGEDINEYRQLIEDVPEGGTIGELGCAWGRSICSVADIIKRKNLKVIIVDCFTGTPSEGLPVADYQGVFEDNLKRFGIEAEIHKGFTNDVAKDIPDGTFNELFIDCDHQYESVKQDLENWVPKIKTHGTISGHDYNNGFGVSKAVNERWSNIRLWGSVWSKRL
jgi:glycosyltransferase involved in cell wall biosynthesis